MAEKCPRSRVLNPSRCQKFFSLRGELDNLEMENTLQQSSITGLQNDLKTLQTSYSAVEAELCHRQSQLENMQSETGNLILWIIKLNKKSFHYIIECLETQSITQKLHSSGYTGTAASVMLFFNTTKPEVLMSRAINTFVSKEEYFQCQWHWKVQGP